jgi:enoyl-CoA hydratase/carnithine racemase
MSSVETEVRDAILKIALNRPEKKNALTSDMYLELHRAIEEGEQNPEVRVLLLHGNGDSFCAGNDLEDFLQQPWKGLTNPPAERFIRTVAGAQKPVVAAIHGSCVGIGATILLHCDLVYAAESAKLIMPFVNLGVVPEAGSTLLLPAILGHRRAAELLMLGTPLSAVQARDWGLVNAVVPQHALIATALQAAQELAAKPSEALQACKRMMKKHHRSELDTVIREEVVGIGERLDSSETREALSAFLEKRRPDFSKLR